MFCFVKLAFKSAEASLSNTYNFKTYHKLSENTVSNFSFYIASINSLDGSDVRVSERIYLSSRRLRGFEPGKVGPKDNEDFIGGNYITAVNLSSTIPQVFPSLQNLDISVLPNTGQL